MSCVLAVSSIHSYSIGQFIILHILDGSLLFNIDQGMVSDYLPELESGDTVVAVTLFFPLWVVPIGSEGRDIKILDIPV